MTPVVLVHGNPETDDIWDPLVPLLGRDRVIRLSPPGFGAPVPPGFGATSDDYRDWLIAELTAIGEPVDLVGHDWGGGHVIRVACTRPDLLRSWASDIAGCFDPDYTWHDMARLWQTPGAGEQAVEAMVGAPADQRAQMLAAAGMGPEIGARVAARLDADTGRCILALYRSAAQPAMARWGAELPAAAARPGLVIIPTADHFTGGEAAARRSAERAGAAVAVLEGLGHWWMIEDPAAGAAALRGFWEGLPAG